mmetsp:Transcript_27728/g.61889  ORF Transcript_27728/g.61889 Transcript_27728/m.61889 type:complete len:202 (-) Transcript_27728:117-722(-)
MKPNFSPALPPLTLEVAGVGDVAAGDAIEDTVDRCGKLSKKLDKDKKTLENELRLIRDPEAKNGWKEKIDSLGSRLAQAKSALETKREQAELFRGVSDDGGGGGASGGNVTHVGPTNDEYLDRAEQVHDQIDGSLQNMAGMTDEMEELGDAIAEQLDAQTQQIASIHTVRTPRPSRSPPSTRLENKKGSKPHQGAPLRCLT